MSNQSSEGHEKYLHYDVWVYVDPNASATQMSWQEEGCSMDTCEQSAIENQ